MGDINPANTPYTYYSISKLGNPDISWETVEKRNFGIDYALFNGLIAGSVDIFNDTRTDILVKGSERAIASYFGQSAPDANLGKVNSHGYELELRLNHTFNNGIRTWLNTSMTHAVNKVKFRDDAPLKPTYQRGAGHTIDQTYAYIDPVSYTHLDVYKRQIWCSTFNGLCKLNYQERKIANYFSGNGLVDKEYLKSVYFQRECGNIYLGGLHGITKLRPDSVGKQLPLCMPQLTHVYLNDKEVSANTQLGGRVISDHVWMDARQINLTYKNDIFSFEFSTME